MILLIIST